MQDDWRVSNEPDRVPGPALRARGRLARERATSSRTSSPTDGGHHVVPNAAGRGPAAARRSGPRSDPDRRARSACPTRSSTPTRTTSARASASPGALGGRRQDGACAAASASSTRPSPCRACATCWPRTVPLQRARTAGATLAHGFSAGTPSVDPADFGSQGIDPNIQSPDIYQYNLTLEKGAARRLRRAPELHRLHDAEAAGRPATSTRCPPSTTTFDPTNPDDLRRACRSTPTATTWTTSRTAGSGQLHAAQIELRAALAGRPGLERRLHLAHSDSNAPDSGNSSVGRRCMFDPYDIEKDRGPDPNVVKHRVVANAHLGHPGRARAQARRRTCRAGRTRSSAAGRSRRSSRRRSGNNLTPFFYGFYTTSPWNTGKRARRARQLLRWVLAPGPDQRPEHRRHARRVLRRHGVRAARRREARQREEGQPARAGHVGRELRASTRTSSPRTGSGCSSRRCSTTRSTTRSSSSSTATASPRWTTT